MNSIWQDVRFGLRMLWKHRLATGVCILALALGIGANAAMFSLAEAFLLHPVPFENADRILALVDSRANSADSGAGFGPQEFNAVAAATFLDWKKQARSFDEIAAYGWDAANLTGDREAQKIQEFRITANFFDTIGVAPVMGRSFLPDEEEPGKDRVIILGHALWEQRYASDPQIIGRQILVDGKTCTVVGVMKKGFDYPNPAEAWMPLTLDAKERVRRDNRWLWVLGRLKPGVSYSEAVAEMHTIAQQQADAYPDTNKGWLLQPQLLRQFITSSLTRQYMILLMGAVGFVLLIACADVANVQFARVTGRTREFAIRTALGGSRWRVVRQLLIESILLSLGGAALGLLFAQWDIRMILSHMPPDVAKFVAGWTTIGLDTNAFLYTLAIAVVSGILAGIAPSLLGSRLNVNATLREGGRGATSSRSRHRLRAGLAIAEVAIALVLLVGAGLLVKGFRGLLNVNEGYSPTTLLTLNLGLPEAQYSQPPQRLAFHNQLLERVRTIPGIESAAIVSKVPYADGGGIDGQDFTIEGRAVQRGELVDAIVETAAPSYFPEMNIPLRDGRFLTDSDGADGTRVAVISQSLADRYFPGQNPLGKHIKIGKSDSDSPWMTVVGIVGDLHYSWITKELVPTIYRSYAQAPPYYTTIVLRTSGDPLKFVSSVRAQVASIDPNLPLYDIKPMDKVITESIIGIAYVAAMMGVLGIIALVLASAGIFGVMSYSVSERAHEIGVRMSLGAQTGDILGMVLRSGLLLTGAGLAIGLPVAYILAQALASLLFGVRAADPLAFLGLPLVLAAVATLACYLPARRAVRLDPIAALRHD